MTCVGPVLTTKYILPLDFGMQLVQIETGCECNQPTYSEDEKK